MSVLALSLVWVCSSAMLVLFASVVGHIVAKKTLIVNVVEVVNDVVIFFGFVWLAYVFLVLCKRILQIRPLTLLDLVPLLA